MILSAQITNVEPVDPTRVSVTVNMFALDGSFNVGPQQLQIDLTAPSINEAILDAIAALWASALPNADPITHADIRLAGVFNT